MMKDKDKLYLLFNVCITNLPESNAVETLTDFEQVLEGMFDDSVKVFINPTRDESKPLIEVVTDTTPITRDMVDNFAKCVADGNAKEAKRLAVEISERAREEAVDYSLITW